MAFLLGGIASALASVATTPLDTLKVRLQTAPPGTSVMTVASQASLGELYSGLDAAVLRSLTYASARFAVYDRAVTVLSVYSSSTLLVRILSSVIGGAVGGAFGAPADLVNIRMQSQQGIYANAFDGLIRIGAEEGIAAYFTGIEITIIRAVLMTLGQLVTYDLAKEAILSFGLLQDGFGLHFAASIVGGVVATTLCAPADVVKSRIMAQSKDKPAYTGTWDAFSKIYQKEGLSAFFNGWWLAFARLAPQTILVFVILEQLKVGYAQLPQLLADPVLLRQLYSLEFLWTIALAGILFLC
ncbi:mitochondrial carrier domain-containing protein [Chytriomyces cf. hyalinus JEL632]|nr:mitochondrial carrier domain-containing protein [Chytriomyces cf. hyalinus JEL632]